MRVARSTWLALAVWTALPASADAVAFEPRLDVVTGGDGDPHIAISWCVSDPGYGVEISRKTSVDDSYVSRTSGYLSSATCSWQDPDPKTGENYYYLLETTPGADPTAVELTTVPEHPINDRRDAIVAAIYDPDDYPGKFKRPHIPPHATSADGRIAVQMGGQVPSPPRRKGIYLFAPERLTQRFAQNAPGPTVMAVRPANPTSVCALPSTSTVGEPFGCGIAETDLYDANTTWLYPPRMFNGMSTVCDMTYGQPPWYLPKNPYACGAGGAYDCYDLTLLNFFIEQGFTANGNNYQTNLAELWATKVRVTVSNPRTASAQIHDVERLAPPVRGLMLPSGNPAEPMVTGDGRLFVGRAPGSFYWKASPTSQPVLFGNVMGSELFYAINKEQEGQPCDVTAWRSKTVWKPNGTSEVDACAANPPLRPIDLAQPTDGRYIGCPSDLNNIFPISHAPYDTYMSTHYGFARYPFRDSEDNLIGDGQNTFLTYPWMDRGGKNLFFTHNGTRLHYVKSGAVELRYPARCPLKPNGTPYNCNLATAISGSPYNVANPDPTNPLQFEWGDARGVGLMGLWTHGKAVFLDNNLNHNDYGTGTDVAQNRAIELYQPQTGPAGTEAARVHISSGRENASHLPVWWSAGNSAFMQSQENLWNGLAHVHPRTPRDVVWRMNTGVASDEVVFDDYVDKGMLIFSDMRASFERVRNNPDPFYQQGTWVYKDGFRSLNWLPFGEGQLGGVLYGDGFLDPPRLANQATSPLFTERPHYGELKGPARIEPIAMGGVVGRGLWLNGSGYAEYLLPNVSQYAGAWLFGVFVDPRPDDGDGPSDARQLLEFPNGSRIDLVPGTTARLEKIRITSAIGTAEQQLPQDVLVPQPSAAIRWRHLAFRTNAAGTNLRVFVDGYPVTEVAVPAGAFALTPGGSLRLGNGPSNVGRGFEGWLDEFRVQRTTAEFHPSQICSFARGQLSRVGATPDTQWQNVANSYSAWAHDQVRPVDDESQTGSQYVCFLDLATPDALPVDEPSNHGLADIRIATLFSGEGTLAYDAPRPDSSGNEFCLSCHDDSFPVGLHSNALAYNGSVVAALDPRRQPMQPPARLFGNIPAAQYGSGHPAQATVAKFWGCPTDALVLNASATSPGWCPPACTDGLDNDGDSYTDASDPQCGVAGSIGESVCSDGLDNDGDLMIDFDGGSQAQADPGCANNPQWEWEGPICGIGFELAFVLPPLMWLRRWRSRRSAAAGPDRYAGTSASTSCASSASDSCQPR